jgi:hypothetical protein
MFSGAAGGALPGAVIGHRPFDAKVPLVEIGDNEEKRRGRVWVEFYWLRVSPAFGFG